MRGPSSVEARGLDRYREALDRVVTCGLDALAAVDLAVGRAHLDLVLVAPGCEVVRNDTREVIVVAVSSPAQLLPPPRGGNYIYGIAHELGHLSVAWCTAGGVLPPITWDEAWAHLVASEIVLPAVWDRHGPRLWPDDYPDYPARELDASRVDDGSFGAMTILRRDTARLAALATRAGGVGALGRAVGQVARESRVRPDRWLGAVAAAI